jgi:hypothetical protein
MTERIVGGHIELDEEARSGQTALHIRYVLLFSTLLALIDLVMAAIFT